MAGLADALFPPGTEVWMSSDVLLSFWVFNSAWSLFPQTLVPLPTSRPVSNSRLSPAVVCQSSPEEDFATPGWDPATCKFSAGHSSLLHGIYYL